MPQLSASQKVSNGRSVAGRRDLEQCAIKPRIRFVSKVSSMYAPDVLGDRQLVEAAGLLLSQH